MSDSDAHDADAQDSFRPLSGLAVAGAVGGVASLLALASPLLLIVPVVAGVLSALGLRAIARSDGLLIGRVPALLGLGLSIAIAVQAVTGAVVGGWFMRRQAEQVAIAWHDAVREDRLLDACAMLEPLLRGSIGRIDTTEEAEGLPADAASVRAAYRVRPEVAAVIGCGPAAKVQARLESHVPESFEREEVWNVRLVLSPCADRERAALDVEMEHGMVSESGRWVHKWLIRKVIPAK